MHNNMSMDRQMEGRKDGFHADIVSQFLYRAKNVTIQSEAYTVEFLNI